MIVSTLLVTVGALLLAVPIGIGVAAYLSDVAHWRVREILKPVVEILAGIPSVVVGFLGIVLFGPFLAKIFHTGNGLNALNGSILLAIMALPTIISISEDSLNAVPRTYTEASLALGASRWQTLVRVKLPGRPVRHHRRDHARHGPGHRRDHDRSHGHGQRPVVPARASSTRSGP